MKTFITGIILGFFVTFSYAADVPVPKKDEKKVEAKKEEKKVEVKKVEVKKEELKK
jgi:hypothetical protein